MGDTVARSQTQVGIVGAGPAGLMLSHLLHLKGIDSIVLEARSRAYCEERVRAGVLEHTSVRMLHEAGVGERLDREGLRHEGIELGLNGVRHRIPFVELTGKCVTVYGQQEVVKDLIERRLADGGDVRFECGEVSLEDIASDRPRILVNKDGNMDEIRCEYIAGCDGFHGVCRGMFPEGALSIYERAYPFAWLGILAEAAPSREELVYMHHERGFALYSMRSPRITRLYLQCAPEEDLAQWSDDRIWSELHDALELHGRVAAGGGPHSAKGRDGHAKLCGRAAAVRAVVSCRRCGAYRAAHRRQGHEPGVCRCALSGARHWERSIARETGEGWRDTRQTCLGRIWKAQRFSWWMTSLLHRFENEPAFDHKRQLAELEYVMASRAAATSLAENYVGLPLEGI